MESSKREREDEEMLTEAPSNAATTHASSHIPKRHATAAKFLHMNELQVVFHLPMAEAAIKLGVCSTVLKKICRRYGIARWPYRQIRKIDKAMNDLEQSKTSSAVLASSDAAEELTSKTDTLKKLRDEIINNPEIDRSTELGATLSEKTAGSTGGARDSGGGLAAAAVTAQVTGTGVRNTGGFGSSFISSPAARPFLPQAVSAASWAANGAGGKGGGHSASQLAFGQLGYGFKSSEGGGGLSLGPRDTSVARGEATPLRLEEYHPADLQTVFPAQEPAAAPGAADPIDLGWEDTLLEEPGTGMLLFRGEHYEWLAAAAAAAVVGRGVDGNEGGSGNRCALPTSASGGLCATFLDEGPTNDEEATLSERLRPGGAVLCPVLPALAAMDVGATASDFPVVATTDAPACGPFDSVECRAGIAIW